MQVPKRRGGKYSFIKPDLNLTLEKFNQLKFELERLKARQPKAAAEVRRTAEMGDRSDNAAYSIAKGKLIGINQKIHELENQLKKVTLIKPSQSGRIGLGNVVTLSTPQGQKSFQILGSQETDPKKGVISHQSPLGQALMGKRVGEKVEVKTKDNTIEYKIVKIE